LTETRVLYNLYLYIINKTMVKDIFVAPIFIAVLESAWMKYGKSVLGAFRSFPNSKLIEALICALNWLRLSLGPFRRPLYGTSTNILKVKWGIKKYYNKQLYTIFCLKKFSICIFVYKLSNIFYEYIIKFQGGLTTFGEDRGVTTI
jgi:hypothetical protein